MDAVITYVNGADPLWKESYEKAVGQTINEKRFRDWGTLKYLLRGIETNMPFIEKVFLVVSGESQVPQWASENLHIVLHRDIIPQKYLPTFNSAVIEQFLHCIGDLSEEFIYFNDDLFPVKVCSSGDFFTDGKAAINFRRHLLCFSQYKKHTRNSYLMACRAAGVKPGRFFLRPQHTVTAMLKSENSKLYASLADEIGRTITPLRDDGNVNQYLYSDYLFLSAKCVASHLKKAHFSLSTASVGRIARFLDAPDKEMMCVNDTNVPQARFREVCLFLNDELQKKFPVKSRFEK